MAVTLDNGQARVTIRPDLGAGATRYDFFDGSSWQAILRRVDDATAHPFGLSNILLAPFSGRVSGGGFTFEGRFHALEPNLPTEKYPIHGNAFSLPWTIVLQAHDRLVLTLAADGPGPFRYSAVTTYRLEGPALVMSLEITNRGMRLPFGVGFHPWFVRNQGTTLTAPAQEVWLESEDHLPVGVEAVASHGHLDFAVSRQLPQGWVNNGFSGWDGKADIEWPSRGIDATVVASPTLDTYMLFSPSAEADFFCFEPVSHPVDAFNLVGGAERHGMTVLDTGETVVASMAIHPRSTLDGAGYRPCVAV
jgi:aldose 1-epimerase